mgnify:CR=1 FL=1
MKENKLNFRVNEDQTLVVLTEELNEKVLKEINSLKFTAQELAARIKDGTLQEGFKETLISLLEAHTVSLCKDLNFEAIVVKEREQRYVEIRSLNEQNRQLRKELGDKVSLEDIREKLKSLEDNIRLWWNIEGFGHTSEVSFKGYGIEVLLSGMITNRYYGKKEESSEKDKISFLKEKGFEIENDNILDTDINKDLLLKLIKRQYPSGNISEIQSNRGYNSPEKGQIWKIKMWLSNYNEINYIEE